MSFLKAMIEKIQERSPIASKLVRVSAVLDPTNMLLLETQDERSAFDKVVDMMYSKKRIGAKQGDNAREQFIDFLKKVVRCNKVEFANFEKKIQRLDEFLGFCVNQKVYSDILHVCKFVFTLSHGQSPIERAFNVKNSRRKFERCHPGFIALCI